MPDLVTRADVKTALQITSADLDSMIDQLLPQVTVLVQTQTGRTLFQNTAIAEYPAGRDHGKVRLREAPLASITSLWISEAWPRVYDASTLLVSGTDYAIENEAAGIVTLASRIFPDGPKTVKVIYSGGYATIPTDLQRAAIEIIASKLFRAKDRLYHVATQNRGDGGLGLIQDTTLTPHDIPLGARHVIDSYCYREAA